MQARLLLAAFLVLALGAGCPEDKDDNKADTSTSDPGVTTDPGVTDDNGGADVVEAPPADELGGTTTTAVLLQVLEEVSDPITSDPLFTAASLPGCREVSRVAKAPLVWSVTFTDCEAPSGYFSFDGKFFVKLIAGKLVGDRVFAVWSDGPVTFHATSALQTAIADSLTERFPDGLPPYLEAYLEGKDFTKVNGTVVIPDGDPMSISRTDDPTLGNLTRVWGNAEVTLCYSDPCPSEGPYISLVSIAEETSLGLLLPLKSNCRCPVRGTLTTDSTEFQAARSVTFENDTCGDVDVTFADFATRCSENVECDTDIAELGADIICTDDAGCVGDANGEVCIDEGLIDHCGCNVDDDCPSVDQPICNTTLKRCEAGGIEPGCAADGDCADKLTGAHCYNPGEVTAYCGCESDTDCPVEAPTCTLDNAPYVCVVAPEGCASDDECADSPAGSHCIDAGTPDSTCGCTDDSHCDAEWVCSQSQICVPDTSVCADDSECAGKPAGEHCFNPGENSAYCGCESGEQCPDPAKPECDSTTKRCSGTAGPVQECINECANMVALEAMLSATCPPGE